MASRQPPTDPLPDLFAGARDERAIRRAPPPPIARTVLPANLPEALTGLPDSDLRRLQEALAVEMQRRNLVTAPTVRSALEPAPAKSKLKVIEPVSLQTGGGPTLSQGKVNAIRAAVNAGVKPSMITRQFGVSLAAIRKALEGM